MCLIYLLYTKQTEVTKMIHYGNHFMGISLTLLSAGDRISGNLIYCSQECTTILENSWNYLKKAGDFLTYNFKNWHMPSNNTCIPKKTGVSVFTAALFVIAQTGNDLKSYVLTRSTTQQ